MAAKKKTRTTSKRTSEIAPPRKVKLTADDALNLSDWFEDISEAMRAWRAAHADALTNEQIKHLRHLQIDILHYADDLTTMAVGLVIDEAAVSVQQLHAATIRAKNAIQTIDTTKRVVQIAAAAIALAASLVAKDIPGAAKGAAALFELASAQDDRVG